MNALNIKNIKYVLFAFSFVLLGPSSITFVDAATCASFSNTNNNYGFVNSGRPLWAEPFTVSSQCDVGSATIPIGVDNAGHPTAGNARLYIYTNSAGVPGTSVDSGTTVTSSTVWPTYTDTVFNGYNYCLPAGNYWLVLGDDNAGSDGFNWGANGSLGGAYYFSGSWTAAPLNGDNIFELDDGGSACGGGGSGQTGIDAAVNVATTSFRTTFGFDMDAVSIWMWDNLGQPILGSGIGTLYVMRYYWLGFIAISIIVLFAFAYFRFFKH